MPVDPSVVLPLKKGMTFELNGEEFLVVAADGLRQSASVQSKTPGRPNPALQEFGEYLQGSFMQPTYVIPCGNITRLMRRLAEIAKSSESPTPEAEESKDQPGDSAQRLLGNPSPGNSRSRTPPAGISRSHSVRESVTRQRSREHLRLSEAFLNMIEAGDVLRIDGVMHVVGRFNEGDRNCELSVFNATGDANSVTCGREALKELFLSGRAHRGPNETIVNSYKLLCAMEFNPRMELDGQLLTVEIDRRASTSTIRSRAAIPDLGHVGGDAPTLVDFDVLRGLHKAGRLRFAQSADEFLWKLQRHDTLRIDDAAAIRDFIVASRQDGTDQCTLIEPATKKSKSYSFDELRSLYNLGRIHPVNLSAGV